MRSILESEWSCSACLKAYAVYCVVIAVIVLAWILIERKRGGPSR